MRLNKLICAMTAWLVLVSACLATDLSITAANVKVGGSGAKIQTVRFGADATNGQVVYKASDGDYELADANSLTAYKAKGIVLVGNTSGGYGQIIVEGPIAIGATVTAGMNYVVSSAAGGIAPVADLGSTEYVFSLGHAISTSVIYVNMHDYETLLP